MKTGEYFKLKEMKYRNILPSKGWFVIRVDGKAFSTYTQGLIKPFDTRITDAMIAVAKSMCAEIQNVKMAFYQSDEISIVLSDLDNPETNLWFDGQVQKMVSVASSLATAYFNQNFKHPNRKLGLFDARVFRLDSEEDVKNYLLWRQNDAIKNGITAVSLKYYSHREIHGKSSDDKLEMIKSKGDNVSQYHQGLIQGFFIKKEIKRVPSTNPKTNQVVYADRSFWVDEIAPKFNELEDLKNYYSFRK